MPARDANTKRTWGSHVPINKSLIDTFDVTGVLELGIGYNSTPAFFETASFVVGVENDKSWIEEVQKSDLIKQDKTHYLIHHELPANIIRSTRRNQVNEQVFAQAREFYQSVLDPKINMAFVDCYSSMRYEALMFLVDKVDMITFHDYQPPGISNHYEGGVTCPNGYQFFIDQTYSAHTGLWIRDELVYNNDAIDKLVSAMTVRCNEWIEGSKPKLVKV